MSIQRPNAQLQLKETIVKAALPYRKHKQRGMALVAVFLIMALMSGLAVALMQMTVSHADVTDNTRDRQQALMLAQAGFSAAVNEINVGVTQSNSTSSSSGNNQTAPVTPGNLSAAWGPQQSYSVTTTDNMDGTYTIVSIGTVANKLSGGNILTVQRKLKAIVQTPSTAGKFIAGAFGLNSLTLTGVAHTDSYDSGLHSTYAQQVANAGGIVNYDNTVGNNGHVGSNGTVTGTGNIIVHGNATPGPGQSVSLSGGALVTGSQAPAPSVYAFKSVLYSPPISASGSYQMSGNEVDSINAGTYRYTSWKQSGGTITFNGTVNLYVDDDFTQSGQGTIVLAPGAVVNLFQGSSGKFDLSGQGVQNPDMVPNNFNIVSASTSSVNVTGQGNTFVTVYAPDASVKISGQGELFGAIIGKDVTLSGLGTFHYDKSARSPGIRQNVVVIAYWEVDM
jgi:Tfp pilus assembly protein PilX